MNEILGKAQTVRELLKGQKYSIDYYQRDYMWESKHVYELIDDLLNKFSESFDPTHERSKVEQYSHYFLGSIIISSRNGTKFLIDGQQRLTTLTLLLIFLNNLQKNRGDAVSIDELIYSVRFAKKSFNLDVDERSSCMESLFKDEQPNLEGVSVSVVNIIARYDDIKEYFPNEYTQDALPYLLDWILENVHFVEITAFSDDDAYLIFETMNDRGLSLSPTDMLKGYLLANISDEKKRIKASLIWREYVDELYSLSKEDKANKEDLANFFKAWLRSQYAQTIRERKRGANPGDFDRLGTEFHRWIRDHRDDLNLKKSDDFVSFLSRDLAFYAHWYIRIRKAAMKLTKGMEEIYYNAHHDFTLQYPVLLSPLKPGDSDEKCLNKIRIVGSFIDILITRRIWNYRDISASTMQYAMFLVMRDIRNKSPEEIASLLIKRLESDTEPFGTGEHPFGLHGMNRKPIHRILARITDFVEQGSGMPSHYEEFMLGRGNKRYEVEHIWADHFERHRDEFAHPADFQNIRNRIGGLLLLPKSFNASYGDLKYKKKLSHYLSQNLIARSLHPQCYERNPAFKKFIKDNLLPFRAHEEFKKADIEKRQDLYRAIAELVWSTSRLSK